ncbi:hypothetical protein FOZ60_006521 [Perkinsus olseni]|uniref:legumain n=2 Tax=Perkinsus olseni TaxID=32597 RepID=A0A7J6U6N2_PEROL|nr:hypothetical protein FOZ60_006521 [Perkinsus olseni]KAF4753404.1 hypothetical protein FOZ62_029312 [Perkinsus olseni]
MTLSVAFAALLCIGPSIGVSQPLGDNSGSHHWAVLIAGSKGYDNYGHQADICHAYQILKRRGIPEEHIITFSYNDVVNDPKNPYPGNLFNEPTDTDPGVDVYEGCKLDYSHDEVTVKNVEGVLTGDTSLATGRVLKSTKDDYVFINYVNHGGPGLLGLVDKPISKKQVRSWLEAMETKKMYKQLVFYVEACESGSMFDGLPTIPNQYYVTAANESEVSFATYCTPNDVVGNVSLGTCLGDHFSVNWMEDEETRDPRNNNETLQHQYDMVRKETDDSHVMQYGDTSFTQEPTEYFMGNRRAAKLKFLSNHGPGSEAIARGVLQSFFGSRRESNSTWEEETLARKARLRDIKKASSIPSPMVPIHLRYSKLREEERKPSNREGQLQAAEELLMAVQGRVKQLRERLGK